MPDDITLSQYQNTPWYNLHQRKTPSRWSPTQEEERSQRQKKKKLAGRVQGKGKGKGKSDDDDDVDVEELPRRRSSRIVGRK